MSRSEKKDRLTMDIDALVGGVRTEFLGSLDAFPTDDHRFFVAALIRAAYLQGVVATLHDRAKMQDFVDSYVE